MKTPCSNLLKIASVVAALPATSLAATTTVGDLASLGANQSVPTDVYAGTIVTNQFASSGLLNITGTYDDENGAVAPIGTYDTNGTGGADDDLERMSGWSGGNLSAATTLGLVLIIQEQPATTGNVAPSGQPAQTGFISPDDNQTGGSIKFELDTSFNFNFFGITLIDADADLPLNPTQAEIDAVADTYRVILNGTAADGVTDVTTEIELIREVFDPTSYLYRGAGNANGFAQVELGERSLNEFGVIDFQEEIPGATIDEVIIISTGESGGNGSFLFSSVPEPTSALLCLLGAGLAFKRRR